VYVVDRAVSGAVAAEDDDPGQDGEDRQRSASGLRAGLLLAVPGLSGGGEYGGSSGLRVPCRP
jgi:hypothetical protein